MRGPGLAEVRGNRPSVLPPSRGGAAHRRCIEAQAQDRLGAEDEVQRPHRADGGRRFGGPPQVTLQGPARKAESFLLPPPKGSVLTFDTKSAIATYWRPGWPLRGWMDWAGRRLCRPPAGHGVGGAPLPGRFRRKRRGRCGRLGDRSPTGNAPGSEDSAYRVAAQVAAVFREPLGMLRDWESGSRGDGDL
jgi:hypothetical protein